MYLWEQQKETDEKYDADSVDRGDHLDKKSSSNRPKARPKAFLSENCPIRLNTQCTNGQPCLLVVKTWMRVRTTDTFYFSSYIFQMKLLLLHFFHILFQ